MYDHNYDVEIMGFEGVEFSPHITTFSTLEMEIHAHDIVVWYISQHIHFNICRECVFVGV